MFRIIGIMDKFGRIKEIALGTPCGIGFDTAQVEAAGGCI